MLKILGFNNNIEKAAINRNILDFNELARVIAVHRDLYVIRTNIETLNSEITGNLRYSASCSLDFPTVGDWVRFIKTDENHGIILEILDRSTVLQRKAVGKFAETQLLAANIDYSYITMSVGQDFNLNRLDRFTSLCFSGNIKPIILLTKIDLISISNLELLKSKILDRYKNTALLTLSSLQLDSFKNLALSMEPYKTYCFIGSSGVGKTTIINYLTNSDLKTKEVSNSNNKGKHTTTHRELFILPSKSIVIDTPGMREVGVINSTKGLNNTFDNIEELAKNCRFSDCKHINEKGCAVLDGITNGSLSQSEYKSYLKLKKEEQHFSKSSFEKRKSGKQLTKMIKDYKSFKG